MLRIYFLEQMVDIGHVVDCLRVAFVNLPEDGGKFWFWWYL